MKNSEKNKQKLMWRLELNLCFSLEKTNLKFTKAIEEDSKELNIFIKCKERYQQLINIIQRNQQIGITNPLLESYYLEASLYKLQAMTNSLSQEPLTEEEIVSNDKKLKQITVALTKLFSAAKEFAEKQGLDKRKETKFVLDCKDSITKIKDYATNWETNVKQRKGIYYYNYALHLIEQANVHKAAEKADILEKSIKYLQLSLKNYKCIPESEQDQTILDQLIKENQQKAFKLRQQTSDPNSQKRKALPETTHLDLLASKKPKPEPTVKTNHSLLLERAEQETQAWEEKIKKSLNEMPLNNYYYLRYAKLFFTIANKLTSHTKESDNHYLLTKLSWLSIAKNLTALSQIKDIELSEEISQQINFLSQQHHRNLRQISIQKRSAAYPIYSESDLESQNLCDLLSDEILDYHYGLEAFQLHTQGTNFLSTVHKLIKKESNHSLSNALQEIKASISSIDKNVKNLFSANLLRELFKFYTCQENKEWLESNINFKGNEPLFYSEHNKLLIAALAFAKEAGAEGKGLIVKLHQSIDYLTQMQTNKARLIPLTAFFQANTMPSLESILEKHLKFILELRKSSIMLETSCKSFLSFIQQQCKKQKEAQESISTQSVSALTTKNASSTAQ